MNEKWSRGKQGGTVISDTPPNERDNWEDVVEYYGGYLVAESIPETKYVNLISAASLSPGLSAAGFSPWRSAAG